MHLGVLSLDFRLHGCASLKEKRRRLGRLRAKFGSSANLAVCETEFQDSHQRARWAVVAVAASARIVEQSLGEVERWVADSVDATLIDVGRRYVAGEAEA